VVIVEGIGGVRMPLTVEFDLLDLAVEFSLPVVVISRLGPGTINHVLMTIDCIRATKLQVAGIVLNGYDATEATVGEETVGMIIAQCSSVNVLCDVPFDETVDIESQSMGEVIVPSLINCDWLKLARI
jgi:dethiobiotin synthetase